MLHLHPVHWYLVCDLQESLLRYLHKGAGIQSSPYSAYAIPKDFIDIASGEDPGKLMELLKLVRNNLSSYNIHRIIYLL